MLGTGNLPDRHTEWGNVQVMLHAVAAHHHVAQCEAAAEAAGDPRHQQVVGAEVVDGVLRHHGRAHLADAGPQQGHFGRTVTQPQRRERPLRRHRNDLVRATKGIQLFLHGCDDRKLHYAVI